MPLEIKELHIKATISDGTNDATTSSTGNGGSEASAEQMIQACVKEVLRILKEKADR